MYASLAEVTPTLRAPRPVERPPCLEVETLGTRLQLVRRQVQAKQHLFRAGQPLHSIYLVHAGCFKTTVLSSDGREKITGFRMRGDLLGLDALGTPTHGCDAVALDLGEVWELPCAQLTAFGERLPEFRDHLTAALAREIRRDWYWLLNLGTLNAEQRVAAFLLDLVERQRALGYSAHQLMLRMTRSEVGSFLALQLETVVRVLSRLASSGAIDIDKRQIRIANTDMLRTLLGDARLCH